VTAGAGTVLSLACDIRILSEQATFAFLFCRVGLTGADMGAAWLLPRVVGLGRATEWLMLGDGIDAQTALASGLATQVVPLDELMPAARALAARLAKGPTMAISMTKRLLNNELSMDLSTAIESEAIAQALLLRADDHKIFYDAWTKGAAPDFKGR